MPTDLSGKVAIVTGAGSGIGAAVALGLCRDGARVIGVGRTEENLARTASQCAEGRLTSFVGDISSEPDMRRLVAETTERFGSIDILINNAAVYPRGLFLEQPFADWARTIEINVIGTALCCRYVLPVMLERKWGRIINIGSFAGLAPLPGSSAYSVSKAALMSLTRALAVEVDRSRYPDILINEMSPGAVATQMTPQGGADPATVYPRVRFLVDLPAGGPTGQLFVDNRIHSSDHGIKTKLKRSIKRVRNQLTGQPSYE